MSKPVAVFDIDGTVFRSSLLIEMTEMLIQTGVFPPEAKRVYLDEYSAWIERRGSYHDYINKVIQAYASSIKGVKVSTIETLSEIVIKNLSLHTYRYTKELINQLKNTHFIIAISGSPYELVEKFTQKYGFGDFTATVYHKEGGVYNGKATARDKGKGEVLDAIVNKYDLSYQNSVAVGDTEGDKELLDKVERPIAFNPNRNLFELAKKHAWKVVVERKDMIYELEPGNGGYKQTNA